jgi:hypothetical protein
MYVFIGRRKYATYAHQTKVLLSQRSGHHRRSVFMFFSRWIRRRRRTVNFSSLFLRFNSPAEPAWHVAQSAMNARAPSFLGSEFYPSFDTSSPPGYCPQSHEILLNTYWDSRLNALGSRTFITTVHIAAATVISWRCSRKERTWQTQFSSQVFPK